MNSVLILTLLIIIYLLISYKREADSNISREIYHQEEIDILKTRHEQELKEKRAYALICSRNSFKTELSEIFCPFQDGFPYKARDCIFIGNPIDYIIFNNLEAYREGKKEIDDIEIIFFEVKATYSAYLSKVQNAIDYTVLSKRVKFKTYNSQNLTNSQNNFKKEFNEIFCPLQDDFPYNPRDCRFIGNPIDYIIFNNLEAYREGQKEIDDIEIIFVDIRQINSTGLSKVQNAINHAISNKRVKFKTYKYDDDTINKAKATLIDKYYKYM